MAKGIRIKGQHGFLQIDSSYRNMRLIGKSSITIPRATTKMVGSQLVITAGSLYYTPVNNDSVIAIEKLSNMSDSVSSTIRCEKIISTLPEIKGKIVYLISSTNYNTPESVNVYEFSPSFIKSDANYGMRIYNSQKSQLIFDSGHAPLNVVSFKRENAPYVGNKALITDLPSNRRYAVATPENSLGWVVSGVWAQLIYGGFRQYLNNGLMRFSYDPQLEAVNISPAYNGSVDHVDNTRSMLIIDVTNM